MIREQKRHEHQPTIWRSKKFRFVLAGVFISAACAGMYVHYLGQSQMSSVERTVEQPPAPTAPVRKEIADFRMTDLEHGWIQYADGSAKVTNDGSEHWQDAPSSLITQTSTNNEEWKGLLHEEKKPTSIVYKGKEYQVKQSQFLTDRIGWVLLLEGKELENSLLLTTDGGVTWHTEVTSSVKEALQEEKRQLQLIRDEVPLYVSLEKAKLAIGTSWTLIPSTASPGDVVLVRSDKSGEITWEGKNYKLLPFGAGYFTYLPISMQVKPGGYPIGDQQLTIKGKKFETQYLQVTQQMEEMRQDTKRIQADQIKINEARSHFKPEFLFSSSFIQPIEGILTTPFGYTRYVNGKFDSSHNAIDLAAKEGTPIKATNDGVIALADSLYLTGNSIYIDHGMGLFSQYAHMSELRVKTGDSVKKGDIIGLVGTTGFSTGPHLHFTFWAHNVPVNPNLFFNTTPFHWLKQEP